MMLQKKNKKLFLYIFLFFIFASFNNQNLLKINFGKIDSITIRGLDNENNSMLEKKLDFLKNKNIFFLNKDKTAKIIESNNLVEKYSVFKSYPSSLKIEVYKTNFLAFVKKDEGIFLLGSNGKFIKTDRKNKNLPFIFGDFNVESFFELKKIIDETNFNFNQVANLFFFKSGRWDIETKNGLLIKLPQKNIKKSFENFLSFLDNKDLIEVKEIDLRQKNQIIVNG